MAVDFFKIPTMKKILLITILSVLILNGFAQGDKTIGFNKFYKNELKESFKNQGFFYRLWNQYEISPGFTRYALGLSKGAYTKGWDNVSGNLGFRYRYGHLDLGGSVWDGVHEGDTITNAYRFSAGFFTPIGALSFGRRDKGVRGMLLQPAMSLGYVRSYKKNGLFIAPSVHLQLPCILFQARANIEYHFGGGLNIYPELSVQLDALYNLLDPHKVKTGIWERYSTYALYDKTDVYGTRYYDIISTYSRSDHKFLDMGPAWGVTPRYGVMPRFLTDNPYKTYGVGVSGRINFLGADIHYDRGYFQSGVVPNVQALDGTVRSKFDNDQVSGLIPANQFSFEASANVYGVLLGIFKKQAIRGMGLKVTPLNRFNFHLGFTYATVGKPVYDDEAAAIAYTDQFFADHPDVERNAINDPMQIGNEWGVTYGWSYEMGAVGIRSNHKLMKMSGKSYTIEMYYILPITKIFKAYS